MKPEPGRRYTADEVSQMDGCGLHFMDVTTQDDREPMFVVGLPAAPEWPPGAEREVELP